MKPGHSFLMLMLKDNSQPWEIKIPKLNQKLCFYCLLHCALSIMTERAFENDKYVIECALFCSC